MPNQFCFFFFLNPFSISDISEKVGSWQRVLSTDTQMNTSGGFVVAFPSYILLFYYAASFFFWLCISSFCFYVDVSNCESDSQATSLPVLTPQTIHEGTTFTCHWDFPILKPTQKTAAPLLIENWVINALQHKQLSFGAVFYIKWTVCLESHFCILYKVNWCFGLTYRVSFDDTPFAGGVILSSKFDSVIF